MEIDSASSQTEEKFKLLLERFLIDQLKLEQQSADKVKTQFIQEHHKTIQKLNLDELNEVARDFIVTDKN